MHLLTFPLRPLSQLSKRDNVWSQQSTYNITNKIIIKYIFETQLLSIFLKIICIIVLTLTNISDTHRGFFLVYVIRKTDIISIVCGPEINRIKFSCQNHTEREHRMIHTLMLICTLNTVVFTQTPYYWVTILVRATITAFSTQTSIIILLTGRWAVGSMVTWFTFFENTTQNTNVTRMPFYPKQ